MALDLRILGPLDVRRDGRPVRLDRPRERALLALLVVSGDRVVSSEALADDLWAGSPPTSFASALRVHISRLRQALGADGAMLATRPAGYRLSLDGAAVDAERFESLSALGRQQLAAGDAAGAARVFREALALWRGPALPEVADAPSARAVAIRLEEARLAALEDRIDADLAGGEHRLVTGELEALTEAHPLRERLWTLRMLALYRSGRQPEALRAYQDLRHRLGTELGLEPGHAARQLEAAMVRQELPTDVPRRGDQPRPVPAGHPTPFVGRAVERALLARALGEALSGTGGMVLIGGEPGVGKTRLATELCRLVPGAVVSLVGHCYERQGDLPFMPWVEIVEQAVHDTPSALRAAAEEGAPNLCRVFPQLRRLFDDLPPPVELPADQERRHTLDSIRECVSRMSQARPHLFVVEDLQWADASTLLLLEHLAERLPFLPCLVLGTYRDAPADVSPRLAGLLSTLVSRRQAALVQLPSHGRDEVDELLAALCGAEVPESTSAAVYAETEGNVFFVEEVCRHHLETGQPLGERRAGVPVNVQLVIEQRLTRLSPPAQEVLTVAAVAGRGFSLRVIQAAGDFTEKTVISALDEAEQAGLLAGEPSSREERFRFAHELIRQTLLVRASGPRRRRLHIRVADALEGAHDAEIAFHLTEAGPAADPVRTALHLILAGDQADGATAFEQALTAYEQALELLPASDARRRGELHLKIGKAHRSLSRLDEAVSAWNQALSILEPLGATEEITAACWDLCMQLGWTYRVPELLAVAGRGLRAVGDRSLPAKAQMLVLTAAGLGLGGQVEESEAALGEAKRLVEGLTDARVLGQVASLESILLVASGRMRAGLEPARTAVAQLRQTGTPWVLAEALSYLDMALVGLGRFPESDAVEDELEALSGPLGVWSAAGVGRRSRFAKVAARQADLAELEDLAALQWELAERVQSPGWLSQAHTMRGIVGLWRGEWETARSQLAAGARLAVPGVSWYGAHHGLLALLLALEGEAEEAGRVLDEAASALPRPGRPGLIGGWQLAVAGAEVAGLTGDRDRAGALYPLVAEAMAAGNVVRQYDGRLVETAAAMAAAVHGDAETAEHHFRAALHQARHLPHILEQPHVSEAYARFLIGRGGPGDEAQAAVLLTEASAGYRAIGMRRHLAIVEGLLDRR